jgi:type II secretory pathway component PulM
MRTLWNRLRGAFDDRPERERILVAIAAALLLGIGFYRGIVLTFVGMRANAEQRLTGAEQQLKVMTRLRREFDEVNTRLTTVEQRIQGGGRANLRTTLETLARASLVKVESMEPQATPSNDRYRETKVEVGLKEVTLGQAVSYLHQIESSDQVLSVKSLRMRQRKDNLETLDVTFTVSTFEPI